MKNLVLVSSPLQAINTLESIKYFNLVDYKIIIFNNNENAYLSITDIFEQNKVKAYNRAHFKSFVELIKYFIKYKSSLKTVDKLFIGDFEDISQLMYASCFFGKKTNVVFIDDGNKTILGYINNFNITSSRKLISLGWRLKYNILDLFINRSLMIRNSTVFSIYTPQIKEKFNFIKNNMHSLKQKITSSNSRKGIYIIGSPYIELSLIDSTTFIKGIDYIINKHKSASVFYIPHRKELMNKFNHLLSNEKFNIIDNKTTIELFFIKKQIYPKFVYGFGSSALFTIKELFKKTEIVNLSFDLLNNFALNHSKKSKAKIQSEYQILEDYYTSFGIKKISLTSKNKEFLQS
jgi:hypothetical protein